MVIPLATPVVPAAFTLLTLFLVTKRPALLVDKLIPETVAVLPEVFRLRIKLSLISAENAGETGPEILIPETLSLPEILLTVLELTTEPGVPAPSPRSLKLMPMMAPEVLIFIAEIKLFTKFFRG